MKYYILSLILSVLTSPFLPTSEACIGKMKRSEDFVNYTKACFAKSGFSSPPPPEEIQKPDFNDKCAAKCLLRSFDLIDEQGRIDKDALSDFLEENVSPQILLKLNEMATSCVESSGNDQITGTKTGATPQECGPISKFYVCFSTAADKLC